GAGVELSTVRVGIVLAGALRTRGDRPGDLTAGEPETELRLEVFLERPVPARPLGLWRLRQQFRRAILCGRAEDNARVASLVRGSGLDSRFAVLVRVASSCISATQPCGAAEHSC